VKRVTQGKDNWFLQMGDAREKTVPNLIGTSWGWKGRKGGELFFKGMPVWQQLNRWKGKTKPQEQLKKGASQ